MNKRSIFKNLGELKITLSILSTNFDLIILTETHILPDKNILKINGNNIFYTEGDYK